MDKKRNIKVIVGVVILLAIVIQFARFDNNIATNVHNEAAAIDHELLRAEKISVHDPSDDSFLILYDSTEEVSRAVCLNTERVLSQIKKQYEIVDFKTPQELYPTAKHVIVILEDLNKITNLDSLIAFAENGGHVAFFESPMQNNAFLANEHFFGVVDAGDSKLTNGIAFNELFVPGYKQEEIKLDAVKNFSIPVTLDTDCTLYMTASDKTPLLWSRDVAEGRFVFFNGTMYQDKVMTGFITRSIALLCGDFLYPVINSKVIWLDDFPAPMSNGSYPEIKKLYHKTIREFYFDVWWPEMLKAANAYDVKYSCAMIETYNDKTKEPFLPAAGEISDEELVAIGREIIRSGGELALHGYNHQSLTMDYWKADELGYHKWKSQGDMEKSLRAVKEKLERSFPHYEINSYVPPSNVISEEGIRAIKAVFPEIDIVSSVYYEDYEGLSYSQEFSYTDDRMLNLPRFSAGYYFGSQNKLSVLNGILAFGAVQHFIHPDDFMDPERSEGRSWPEQLESYEEFLGMVDTHYPFIESNTASEAAVNLEKYLGLDYTTQYAADEIRVVTNATVFPMSMFFHTEKKLGVLKNCEAIAIDDDDYLVTFTARSFSLGLEEEAQ